VIRSPPGAVAIVTSTSGAMLATNLLKASAGTAARPTSSMMPATSAIAA
jgi:hypothetical protein